MPDVIHPTRLPGADPKLVFLTSYPAARLAGVSPATIRRQLAPDAMYVSDKGDKVYPLWLRETVEQFRATYERPAGGPGYGHRKSAGGAL
jgi:hypothetical protein